MTSLRHHLARHRLGFAWLIAAALAMRLLVPAGFMPVVSGHSITITLCSGSGPMTMAMPAATPGMSGKSDPGGHHDTGGAACPFAGLTTPALGGADVVLIVAAIAFIMALAYLPTAQPASRLPTRLRPPPIGPPTTV